MDWNYYRARAAEHGVPVPELMAMAVMAEFGGSLGRRFIIEHSLWLFFWEKQTPADLNAAIDRCIFEQWLHVAPPMPRPLAPATAVNEPPFLCWTNQGLALARKIFGDSGVRP